MNFKTIKFRIIAFGVGLMLMNVIFRYMVAFPVAEKTLHQLVEGQQLSLASYIAHDVQHSLESRLAFIAQMAGTVPIGLLEQPNQLGQWLDERRRLSSLFAEGLLLIDPQGKQIGRASCRERVCQYV